MGLPDIETIPETGAVFTIGRSRFADNIASHFFIRKDPVVAITCGDEHSAVVCQTGRLFVFGSNDWGQLGLGHKNHISKPSCVKILKPEKVTQVACGRAHTLICTSSQKIFACGSNQEGQLGRESSAIGDSCSSPILVYDCGLAGPKILQIAAGSHHSMALTSDGGVVAWGSNLEGQLGLSGISGLVNKPTKVPISEPVKEISAGYYHSAFLTESGLVYVCGESESGKLGIDVNFSAQVAPKQMQLPVPALHVTCGGHHTLVLAENGNIYCCGSNANGQLGMGTSVNEVHTPKVLSRDALRNEKIVKIACGESHSAILTESGKLFTCGDGRHGKLGLEENENNVHQLTFATKYQELFVSNVACGGCHTILIGRRHEINYQSQRQSNSADAEQSAQKKNSLPPLKLPASMQNEQRVDNTEDKSMNDKHDSNCNDKVNDKLENGNSQKNSANDASKRNLKIQNDSATHDDNVSDSKRSSRSETSEKDEKKTTESQSAVCENELENKEGTQNDENAESKDSGTSKNDQESNEKIETKQDTESSHTEESTPRIQNESEQELSTNSTPPEKPPRLKSVSIEERKSQEAEDNASREEEEEEEESKKETETINEQDSSPKLSDEKANSAISDIGSEKNTEIVEDSVEKMDDGDRSAAKSEKTEVEIDTQDDVDVVHSPAPRTSKMAKLFKTKRQQQIQNGTKRSSTTTPKSKSKTCTIL